MPNRESYNHRNSFFHKRIGKYVDRRKGGNPAQLRSAALLFEKRLAVQRLGDQVTIHEAAALAGMESGSYRSFLVYHGLPNNHRVRSRSRTCVTPAADAPAIEPRHAEARAQCATQLPTASSA